MGKRPAARRCGAARTGTTAQRVLIAQGVLLGAVTLALFVQELPGIVREVRIWRMSNLRSGAKRPR
ncbi:hypothetical protein [Streptomyces sp. NBC_00557]|uniref:hypothetical protein n=1 Tax=Streptomyces sp. NBC_00557 TaxID=2975776 RepID=UPI002E7FC04B|nr:hypothetical protein [Streptomyces sp. NBC_00557]WUC38930.1 hypothetical protein OG956_34220 [Streptomyces sp. NBC_00557]